ncbi:hypothetical protein WISP_48134 [Willisornis vidua]|uniref:Uncharacterized protein n=1 Tax=Willisornis vidua TaxID=1566151 RepID=A0ABQ9DEN3_9PASS|nr:hypothetical protein WISP_48134 [Willisornis vidua]
MMSEASTQTDLMPVDVALGGLWLYGVLVSIQEAGAESHLLCKKKQCEGGGLAQPGEETEGDLISVYKCLEGRASRGWSCVLLGGAKQRDKKQWAESDAQEVAFEYEEGLLNCVADRALTRLPRDDVESPLLKLFKNYLDTILCHVLSDDTA